MLRTQKSTNQTKNGGKRKVLKIVGERGIKFDLSLNLIKFLTKASTNLFELCNHLYYSWIELNCELNWIKPESPLANINVVPLVLEETVPEGPEWCKWVRKMIQWRAEKNSRSNLSLPCQRLFAWHQGSESTVGVNNKELTKQTVAVRSAQFGSERRQPCWSAPGNTCVFLTAAANQSGWEVTEEAELRCSLGAWGAGGSTPSVGARWGFVCLRWVKIFQLCEI